MSISKIAKELIENNNSTKKDNYREAKRLFKLKHWNYRGKLKRCNRNSFIDTGINLHLVDETIINVDENSPFIFFRPLTKGRVEPLIDFNKLSIEQAKAILKNG